MIAVMERGHRDRGFFFRAREPDALSRRYAQHLAVALPEGAYEDPGWFPDRGETVFSAFPPDSDAFGPAEKRWTINFRVDDLDGSVRGPIGRLSGVTAHGQGPCVTSMTGVVVGSGAWPGRFSQTS